jgi:predicted permease
VEEGRGGDATVSPAELPRSGQRLLRRLLPEARWEEAEADLRELFGRVHRERGQGAAVRRFWREVATLGLWRVREGLVASAFRLAAFADPRQQTEVVVRDLRLAARGLTRRPALAAIAMLSLGVGIAVTVAVFTLLNAALLRPLGVPGEESLAYLAHPTLSHAQQRRLREAAPSLEVFAARFVPGVELGDGAETVATEVVTDDYFRTLGLRPAAGRWFRPADERGSPEERRVVLGHRLWETRFGSDPRTVGRLVGLGPVHARIVGVAPPGFRGLAPHMPADLWIVADPRREEAIGSSDWLVVARARHGGKQKQVAPVLQTAARTLLPPETPVRALDRAELLRAMWLVVGSLMAVPGLVLLVACVNVSGLLAARAEERRPEMAVRRALGGSRLRLVRQLLTEGGLLSVGGAALGLVGARWLVDGLSVRILPLLASHSLHPDLRLDARAVTASLVAAAVATLASSLLPALSASRPDLTPLLAGRPVAWRARRRRVSLHDLLVIGQLVVTFAFVASALVCLRGLRLEAERRFGFDLERVLAATLAEPGPPDGTSPGFVRVEERVGRMAGVRRVALATHPPALVPPTVPLRVPGAAVGAASGSAALNRVRPAFFEITGARLLRGRLLDQADIELGRHVAVVTRSAERRLWADSQALGRALLLGPDETKFEVVGVVEEPVEVATLAEPRARPTTAAVVYAPLGPEALSELRTIVLIVEVDRSGPPTAREFTQAAQEVAPNTVVGRARPMEEITRAGRVHAEVASALSVVLGLLSAALGALGLYGVIAHAVARRRLEIGLRMALGGSPRDVQRMILGRGAGLILGGVLIGAPAALASTRLVASAVGELPSLDAATLAAAAALVVGVSLLACAIPAQRATKVDPAATLRAG